MWTWIFAVSYLTAAFGMFNCRATYIGGGNKPRTTVVVARAATAVATTATIIAFAFANANANTRRAEEAKKWGASQPQYTYQWKGPALFRTWPEYGQEMTQMCIPTASRRGKGGRYINYGCAWTSRFKEPTAVE